MAVIPLVTRYLLGRCHTSGACLANSGFLLKTKINMPISEATIQELRQILEEDYGKEITQAEASEILHTLVSYFDLLTKIYDREKLKNPQGNNAINKRNPEQ